MCTRILLVGMVLVLAIGCAKRTTKTNAPSKDETAGVKPQPQPAPPAPNDKNKKDDGPNWLTDSRWKKDEPKADPQDPKGTSNKQPWGISPPQGGWQGPNAGVPPVQPGPGGMVPPGPGGGQPGPIGPVPGVPNPPGMGMLQPQPTPQNPTPMPAPKFSPVTEKDMFDLQVFIDNASGASGKMPSPLMIYQALVATKSPAAELVQNGSIYLTGATTRESVWAFETKAITQGGLVVSQNGVETLTAAQLKARLGR